MAIHMPHARMIALTCIVIVIVLLIYCSNMQLPHISLLLSLIGLLASIYAVLRVTAIKPPLAPPHLPAVPAVPAMPAVPALPALPVPMLPQPLTKPLQSLLTEKFTASNPIEETIRSLEPPHAYPGAIEGGFGETLSGNAYDVMAASGTADRSAEWAPDSNVFNYGRTAAPGSAPIPGNSMQDDEANDEDIDADEANTYQVRSRNDEVRVTAGTMRRRRDMDKYLREEVAEAEERIWWGRHEQ